MTLLSDLRDVRGGVGSRLRRLATMVARATAIPLLVRSVVWLGGAVATALAWAPEFLFSGQGLFLFAIAALPAVAPRTPVVTVVTMLPVLGWMISTTGYGVPVTLWRVSALAAALYLVHSAAALAAQIPYDAIVSPGVLLRWFARAGLVAGGTVVVGVYALVAAELVRGRASLVATVVGLAVAVGLAALLARLLRPRRSDTQ